MYYSITLHSADGAVGFSDETVIFNSAADSADARFSLTVGFPEWEDDAYIFLPACAYDGNRFRRTRMKYPPMYGTSDLGEAPIPLLSDVPALNPDGSGKIEVTSGDLSVPCFGIFFREKKKAFFLFTEQACKGKNLGFAVEKGSVTVQFPVIRSQCYRMCRMDEPSRDSGISVQRGEEVRIKLQIKDFDCGDLSAFFGLFFENRRCVLSDRPCENGYTRELWHMMETHMNRDNFSGEYYAEISKKWQCGWVGGGMSSLPLLKHGEALSRERAVQTIDFMTSHMSPAGFFYGMIENGEISDDGFGHEHMKHALLIRKNGDALYFLFKHFDVITPKESWISAAKTCADAFVRLYRRYRDFGQFVNLETGEMTFGGTASGASAIGALVRAWQYFGNEEYLEVAKLAGEKYDSDFIKRGMTYGGPGEALCAPDSESAYAMTESMVLLYEATKEKKWLKYAVDSLHLLSSWIMPYAYRFPEDSELGRLQINTVGSVFANVQNKHSAPGFCTASGDAVYKIYRYTGNQKYLELLRDVVFCLPQCVSTEARPLYSWDREPRKLPVGWINERINTSDWEGARRIGQVFYGSCWCETSLMLSFSEIIWNPEISHALGLD